MRIIHVPGLEELLAGHYPHYPYNKTFEEARYEPLIALHTSGSTGESYRLCSGASITLLICCLGFPKPIIYSHEFGNTYVNLITSPKPQGFSSANALFQGNRLLQVLPPFHVRLRFYCGYQYRYSFDFWSDLELMCKKASGMLITLLNAVYTRTVMILPLPGVPPSGEGVIAALDHVKVDIAFLYPAVVKEIYQSPALLEGISRIPYVFYAGGDLPDGVGDALSARTRFFTMFGATEIGNFPQLISDVDIDHWEPNDWAYVCPAPAMGAEFRQHTADLYELVIVKDKSLEDYQTCFRIFPEMQEYSLRDLFSKHPTKPGLWRHRGRTDDILVFLNAEKMNPVPMEEAIQAHPSIRSVLLVGERRSQTALLIELMNDTITSRPERDAMIERLWPIIQAANDQVDEFARVSRSLILLLGPGQSMERAGKGTVQRKPTLDLYSDQLDALYAKAGEGGLGLCK